MSFIPPEHRVFQQMPFSRRALQGLPPELLRWFACDCAERASIHVGLSDADAVMAVIVGRAFALGYVRQARLQAAYAIVGMATGRLSSYPQGAVFAVWNCVDSYDESELAFLAASHANFAMPAGEEDWQFRRLRYLVQVWNTAGLRGLALLWDGVEVLPASEYRAQNPDVTEVRWMLHESDLVDTLLAWFADPGDEVARDYLMAHLRLPSSWHLRQLAGSVACLNPRDWYVKGVRQCPETYHFDSLAQMYPQLALTFTIDCIEHVLQSHKGLEKSYNGTAEEGDYIADLRRIDEFIRAARQLGQEATHQRALKQLQQLRSTLEQALGNIEDATEALNDRTLYLEQLSPLLRDDRAFDVISQEYEDLQEIEVLIDRALDVLAYMGNSMSDWATRTKFALILPSIADAAPWESALPAGQSRWRGSRIDGATVERLGHEAYTRETRWQQEHLARLLLELFQREAVVTQKPPKRRQMRA